MNMTRKFKRASSKLGLLAMPMLLGACGTTTAQTPFEEASSATTAQQAITSGQQYRLVSMWSGQVVDVSGGGTANGSQIDQWGYSRGSNQIWTLQASSYGGFSIVGKGSSRCIDIPNGVATNGTFMQLYDCLNNSVQAWNFVVQADGSFIIKDDSTGKCLEIPSNSITAGQRLDEWDCNGGTNQNWRVEPVDVNGLATFGNIHINPDKLGLYMIPDIWNQYQSNWTTTQNSLNLLHARLPNLWVRWDNETGHNYTVTGGNSAANVDAFLSRCNTAGLPMIITASAVNGYNNYWANGNTNPSWSMLDMASSGMNQTAVNEMNNSYPSIIKMVETLNEPDQAGFVSDPCNASHFDTYMNNLTTYISMTSGKLLGPATAATSGTIMTDWLNRSPANVSYHNYNGAAGLVDFTGKQVYVTEYGPTGSASLDPAVFFSDLYTAETTGKLGNTVQKIFYTQLFDSSTTGRGRGGFSSQATEGTHWAISDYLRSMFMYKAMASTNAFYSPTGNQFFAADDGNGNTSVLVWNSGTGTMTNTYFFVPGTSLPSNATLYVTTVVPGNLNTTTCQAYSAQSAVTAAIGKPAQDGSSPPAVFGVTINTLASHAAVMVSTQSCTNLAN